jgi:hypothetical protein
MKMIASSTSTNMVIFIDGQVFRLQSTKCSHSCEWDNIQLGIHISYHIDVQTELHCIRVGIVA